MYIYTLTVTRRSLHGLLNFLTLFLTIFFVNKGTAISTHSKLTCTINNNTHINIHIHTHIRYRERGGKRESCTNLRVYSRPASFQMVARDLL